jgi:hypothetical protein
MSRWEKGVQREPLKKEGTERERKAEGQRKTKLDVSAASSVVPFLPHISHSSILCHWNLRYLAFHLWIIEALICRWEISLCGRDKKEVGEIRRRGEAEDPANLLIMSLFAVVDVGLYLTMILSLLALVIV